MADLLLIFAAFTFFLAGFVKGVIGFGLPPVAIALLGLAMTPAEAAALMIVPSLITNVWQAADGPGLVRQVWRLWPMLLGIGFGTWAGSGLIAEDGNGFATLMLGIALAAYAVVGLTAVQFTVAARSEPWLSPAMGAITGLVASATGVFAIPAVPYLQALGLEKDDLVQALGLSFTVSTVALAVSLADLGVFALSTAGASLLALAPALIGMSFGQRLRSRISPSVFRLCFFLGLLVLGAHLAIRSAV